MKTIIINKKIGLWEDANLLFTDDVNKKLRELEADNLIIDIKYSASLDNGKYVLYSALIIYQPR